MSHEHIIYGIKNLENGKLYVGSTKQFEARKRQHLYHLRMNSHHSIRLQSSWNKYGEENFEFIILEVVENKALLIEREQFWIDKYNTALPVNGYNIVARVADQSRNRGNRLERTRKPMSDETKAKISAANKNMSPESREKLAALYRGRIVPQEIRDKISKTLSSKRLWRFPDNHPFYKPK